MNDRERAEYEALRATIRERGEISFFIHIGIERVGRYLQVLYEPDGRWEHTIMAYGKSYLGSAGSTWTHSTR